MLMPNTVIGVESRVCEGAIVAGNVVTAADVLLGHCCYVAMGCVIKDHVSVGAGAQVGMGSIVIRDVPPGVMVFGNPPRIWLRRELDPQITEAWERVVAERQERA
jgi:acetyltransferase-like isoleucine patch superfamily enzyme